MKTQTFEDFLQEKHIEENPMILDDDLPDHFDGWVSNLDIQEIMDYAQEWGDKILRDIEKNHDKNKEI